MELYVKKENSIEIINRFEKLILDDKTITNVTFTKNNGTTLQILNTMPDDQKLTQFKNEKDFFSKHTYIEITGVNLSCKIPGYNQNISLTYATSHDLWNTITLPIANNHTVPLLDAISNNFDLLRKHDITSKSIPEFFQKQISNYQNSNNELNACLSRLEILTSNQMEANSEHFNELQTRFDTRYREKEEKLDTLINEKKETLDKNIELEKVELKSREDDLQTKIEAFNIKENKGVRRELLKEMRQAIDEHKEITLSVATVKKRKSVMWACLVAMLIGLCLVGLSIFNILTLKSDYQYILMPFSSGIILFSTTFIYFLRWSNSWVNKHTEAEFKNMQFSQDILRASWLAELVFEVGKESETEVPPVLIEQFSKNLFENKIKEERHHPLDDLFKLTKSFKKVKVGKTGIEVEQGNE